MLWQRSAIVMVTGSAVAVAAYMLVLHLFGLAIPSFDSVQKQFAKSSIYFLTSDKKPLVVKTKSNPIQKFNWVVSGELPSSLIQGAPSQLELQVVRLLHSQDQKNFVRAGFLERLRNHIQAKALSYRWTPSQIVEAYLNLAFYRVDVQGLAAAALTFFSKRPSELNNKDVLTLLQRLKDSRSKTIHLHHGSEVLAPPLLQHLAGGNSHGMLTTIDFRLQRALQNLVRSETDKGQVAIIVLDTATNELKATVGAVQQIQVRSDSQLFYPLLYALALDRRVITLASVLQDSPFSHPLERAFHESVTAREALLAGLDIPSVQVLDRVGRDQYADLLAMLGIHGSTTSLVAVAESYRLLIHRGVYSPLRWRADTPSGTPLRLLSEEATFLVTQALDKNEWQIPSLARGPIDARVFTTGGLTVAAIAPAQIIRRLKQLLAPKKPVDRLFYPERIVQAQVHLPELKRHWTEFFISGTEPFQGHPREQSQKTRIVYPVDRSVLPVAQQPLQHLPRIFFQAYPANMNLSWVLNDQVIGQVREFMSWPAIPGSYKLEIHDKRGRLVDLVRFEVKAKKL